jgi:hypothetical protein
MKVLVLSFTNLFLICTLANTVLANPVGIWLFEEGKGDVVSDSSGSGNDGKIVGKAEWVEGKFGKALSLPGTVGNYVTIPDSPTLNPMKQITMMLWIKPDATSITNQSRLFSKDLCCDAANREYGIQIINDKTFVLIIDPGSKNVLGWSKPIISPDKWQHLAGTYDSKTRQAVVYYNGEEITAKVDDAGGDLKDGPTPLLLGYYADTAHWYKGAMDDIAIFDTALSAGEIAKIYKAGLQRSVLVVYVYGKLAVTWGAVKNKSLR